MVKMPLYKIHNIELFCKNAVKNRTLCGTIIYNPTGRKTSRNRIRTISAMRKGNQCCPEEESDSVAPQRRTPTC